MLEAVVAIVVLVAALWLVSNLIGLGLWIVWTLLVGLVVRGLAKMALGNRAKLSTTSTILYGVSGSFLGKVLGQGVLHLNGLLTIALSTAMAAIFIDFLHMKKRMA